MTTPSTRVATKLKLEYPIEFAGSAISELIVRRPKGKDMRFIPSGDAAIEQMFPFFALLAGVEEGVLDEMDAADLTRLGELITGFLSTKKPARK